MKIEYVLRGHLIKSIPECIEKNETQGAVNINKCVDPRYITDSSLNPPIKCIWEVNLSEGSVEDLTFEYYIDKIIEGQFVPDNNKQK